MLVFPFAPVKDIGVVYERLEQAAAKTKAFDLVLDGTAFFEETNNVVYLAIASKKPVIDLHYDINRSLEGLVTIRHGREFTYDRYVLHVTIGEQIPDDVFPNVKQVLRRNTVRFEFRVSSFSLFSPDEKMAWKRVREF